MSMQRWLWGTNSEPRQRMSDMICGFFVSQIVRVLVDLSVPDHLSSGPLTAPEIAARAGSDEQATFRLLRAAVTIDLVDVDELGRFSGTELLATLRQDTPGSLRGTALSRTSEAFWQPWAALTSAVRTGQSQCEQQLGTDFFTYLHRNPDQSEQFRAHMASSTALWSLHAANVIDTVGVHRAVDIGGADGSMLRALQRNNADLHGVVFDRPDVADAVRAELALAADDTIARTTVVGGNFFESVPSADLMILKYILHDWGDGDCVNILKSCRDALHPGGRIAIVEMIMGPLHDPGYSALMDLNMLALAPGAQERSLDEYDELLSRAGLRRTDLRHTPSPQSVIIASKA